MRVYLAAICLFSSMVAQADLFRELKALVNPCRSKCQQRLKILIIQLLPSVMTL